VTTYEGGGDAVSIATQNVVEMTNKLGSQRYKQVRACFQAQHTYSSLYSGAW